MRGIANEKKRRALFDKHRFNADILVMQETHSTPETEKVWEKEWGGKVYYSHGSSAARGIAIFIAKGLNIDVQNVYKDTEGRVIILDLVQYEQKLTLATIYAPNEDSPIFFLELASILRARSEHKIVVGDFNLVLDVELDRENTYNNNNRAMEEVRNICDEFFLKDIWRVQNDQKKEFSWSKKGSFPRKASRIDFALVSGGLDQKIEMVQYISSVFTDHRAVYMVVNFDPFQRGVGYWKLNTSLLQRKDYLDLVNSTIEEYQHNTSHVEATQRWQDLKTKLVYVTKQYSRQKVAEDKLIIAQLSEKVNEYEERLPLNRSEDKLLEETRAELEDKTLERIQGVIFRSKAKWYEEGEKNTKYFYALEKARYNAKTCYKMIDDSGNELLTPNEILDEQRKFYTELYKEDSEVNFTLQNQSGLQVPINIKEQQNQQLTIEDLAIAIKGMNNNKTPGEDGIPVDFYKVFWNGIKQIFFEMMLEVFQNDQLHTSARRGILNLIPKANKDTRYVKNLRPITLLNTDYKIIEKAIANKMLPALEHIISKDQRGFMKERRISVNIRKMLDIIHQAKIQDLEAVVLSLDFVKCFDKCSFSILFGSLEYFQFGQIVKTWTKILYKNFTVRIQNNGHFSQPIAINKGVHQGGCCSSLYFLVIAEILAISLRDNKDIEGITIKDIKNILNQFADDMDIFSLASEKSIRAIYSELESFRLQSGFTVSYDKTTLYRIGSLRHSDAQLYNMSEYVWSNKDINVLGIIVAHEDMEQKNYQGLIEQSQSTLKSWQNRGLTLIGKIQVVNTLVASLFVYKMMVLPTIPSAIVKQIDDIIRKYIWSNKKSKIAYNILQLPKKEGGLNLVNLVNKDRALKATWPQILHSEQEYATMVYGIIRCSALGDNIWRCRLAPGDIDALNFSSPFWKDVLRSWSQYNYYKNFREENQIIWYNSNIKVQGKTIMWKDVYEKGLLYIHQLFENMTFKSNRDLQEQYGLTLLRINSLKSAIPSQWKTFFTSTPASLYNPLPPHNYDLCINAYKTGFSREVYSFLAEDAIEIHGKYIKWRMEIGQEFCDGFIGFRDAHKYIYRTTNTPKYRSFQYRLLQRGLVTNIQLEKWNIMASNLCSFCHQEKESVSHMLWSCPVVRDLWEGVQEFIQNRFGPVQLNMTIENVLVNKIYRKMGHAINFICLIVKQFIYSQRCLKKELLLPVLLAKIRQVESIEKYIAVKNSKLTVHHSKWQTQSEEMQLREAPCETVMRYLLHEI